MEGAFVKKDRVHVYSQVLFVLVHTVVVFYAFPSFQLINKVKVCQKWDQI